MSRAPTPSMLAIEPTADAHPTGRASQWRWGWLIGCQLAALSLLGSWYFSASRVYWDRFDRLAYDLLQIEATAHHMWQVFWALLNLRLVDWLAAGFFLAVFLHYCLRGGRDLLAHRLAEGAFTAIYTILVLDISSEWVFDFERLSPTLDPTVVAAGVLRLSQQVPWIPFVVKDASDSSFPGDHGMALIMFTTLIWYYAGRGYGLVALAGAGLLVFPRLVGGAHWATDVVVGSVSVALVSLSLALATPLQSVAVRVADRAVARLYRIVFRSRVKHRDSG